VSAEVSLGLVDESVYAIQTDYAPDPRAFFFSDRQPMVVQTFASFNQKGFVMLGEKKQEAGAFDDRSDGALHRREALAANAPGPAAEADALQSVGGGRARGMAPMESQEAFKSAKAGLGGAGGGGSDPNVVVRTDFRSTIFWRPDVVTDASGRATIEVDYADSLTRWKATARAFTTGARCGVGTATTRTRKPLIARLQAPRFFVVGDTVMLSGVLNNNTDEPMTVRPELDVEGLALTALIVDGRPVDLADVPVVVPAGGETRVDWQAVVRSPGDARVRLIARSDEHADAMEKLYAVHEHGIERFVARSGRVTGREVSFSLDIPARRKRATTALTVQVTPSMAVTMLDALPYLVDYPYGCTEQTMSRFLPALVTARTLQEQGLSPETALSRAFGGIEADFVDKTHPGGAKKRDNLLELDEVVQRGLDRLADFQHGDGGWGWWKRGSSDHYMTAYVLWGLSLARAADADVPEGMLRRAASYLDKELVERELEGDLQAWMLHALSAHHEATGAKSMSKHQAKALENLWARRDRLNAYDRALLALSAHRFGADEKATVLVRNLVNGVIIDRAPDTSLLLGAGGAAHPAVIGTAHWGRDGVRWRWSEGGIEATAFALQALLAIEPGHELIEPVTNWLVKNRRGAQWSNTRDTAITVLALNDYLRTSGQLEDAFAFELFVNGRAIASRSLTREELLGAPSRFEIDPEYVVDGANEIRIVRTNGEGPIFFAAHAAFFSLEEPIPAAGSELFVRRDYYRLTPRETLLKGFVYDRELLRDGDYVTSGDRIEVVVTVESKNDAEYIVFEDLKPAGLEAVELRSGGNVTARQLTAAAFRRRFEAGGPDDPVVREPGARDADDYTGQTRWIHQELRDRTVAMFMDRLPEGSWEIRYDLRAEVPGTFHALPLLAHAMYVPEIRANSDEIRLTVNDRR
jgi:uncharacterized protein YfaS (alpha-2-macroglobulin family)